MLTALFVATAAVRYIVRTRENGSAVVRYETFSVARLYYLPGGRPCHGAPAGPGLWRLVPLVLSIISSAVGKICNLAARQIVGGDHRL